MASVLYWTRRANRFGSMVRATRLLLVLLPSCSAIFSRVDTVLFSVSSIRVFRFFV